MRKVFVALTTCAGLIALTGPTLAENYQFAANVDSLRPYYLKDGVDLSKYKRIRLDTMRVDNARVVAPPWYEGDDSAPVKWELSQSDINWLRKSYRDAMKSEIETKGGYPVVEEFATDVIILDVELVTLMPYARKGEKVQVRGFGELTIQATLRDGMTSELLAVFEGSQDVGTEYQQNTRLNAKNNLTALFEVWGARMRRVMDDNR